MASPFEEGAAARRAGVRRCPYDSHSIKARRWWSGFHNAQQRPQQQPEAPLLQVDGYTQLSLFGGDHVRTG